MIRVMKKSFPGVLLVVTCLLASSQFAFAHAVLISSTPKVHGTVHGPSIDVDLKFNSRVDGTRSSLSLVIPRGAVQPLALEKQAAPNELVAHAQLNPGKYTLRWTALATDGHITRGEVPFTVE
jgi:copper resistance protein C